MLLQLNMFVHCLFSDWHHPFSFMRLISSANVGQERLSTCLVHTDPTDVMQIRDSHTPFTFYFHVSVSHASRQTRKPVVHNQYVDQYVILQTCQKQWSWKHMELKMTIELHQFYV